MRSRAILAAAAAGVLIPGAAAAAPDEPAFPQAPGGTAAPTEIVLPTGETLSVTPSGALAADAAAGGFITSWNEEGDRIAVPVDALDEVASGELGADEFNVDLLLRGERPDEGEDEEPGATAKLTVTGTWLDGSVPAAIGVSLVNLKTGATAGPAFFEGGTATGMFEPGRYHVLTMIHRNLDDDIIMAIDEVVVCEDGATVTVDGSEALPVGFDVDRDDAVQQGVTVELMSYEPGTQDGARLGVFAYNDELFAVPSGRLKANRDAGFVLRQSFASPVGAADPYSYSLFRAETDGIPADPLETVRDGELSRVDAAFQTRGVAMPFDRFDLVEHPVYEAWAWTDSGEVPLPSSRTEFYTADPDLAWSHKGTIGYEGIGRPYDEVYQSSAALDAGAVQTMAWNDAPVGVGLSDTSGQRLLPPRFYRHDEVGAMLLSPHMFSTEVGGESVLSDFHSGSSSVSLDGELVYEDAEYAGTSVGLDQLGDGGRVRFTAASERKASWTTLGAASSGTWEFDYDPAANPILPVAVVAFDITGFENGAVPAGTTQEVSLEFRNQVGADDQACAAMTFEVSFDDGATWTEVAIDRDGDVAEAVLELPADAAFGSVRFTAADELGNTVEQETIRSFAVG
ncbi:hypothetical protein AB0K52_17945 [Glycomyces sp. NPDC049804]|uniref:hypothetical protein n=1 Tax=Glycomyces sp. NPDC049804 TaxID=3154363 RepID=UPI00344448BB